MAKKQYSNDDVIKFFENAGYPNIEIVGDRLIFTTYATLQIRDATEGTVFCTELCDYLIYYDESGSVIVEGLTKYLKKEINFIPEDEKAFVVGYFKNEKEALQGIIDFERSHWGKK